ncbi:MAG: HTTM domain-containing protein [Actinobacteria bacterium]|nr:HTTM domain-containing protein [Actinomycetota bacterium]
MSDLDKAQRGAEKRLSWLRFALAAGLVAGLLLSPNLWVSTRSYPLTPLWDAVPPLPYPADYALFGLLMALVAGAGLARGRAMGWFAVGALVLAAFLVLQDESRLQPWFYQYSFMLAACCLFGLGRVGALDALNACRLIVVATYFWSGLQKANASFVQSTHPWLVEPLTTRLPEWAGSALLAGGYAVPAVEAVIGVGLLTRRFRKLAVAGAVVMHAFIMLCIGPLGNDHNTVVWPWNFAMVAFVLILFWRAPDDPSPSTILDPGRNFSPGFALRAAVLLLFAFMPLFNFFGIWDSYLSSGLYSGTSKQGYVLEWEGSEQHITRIGGLSESEVNTPAYPEESIFENVFAERWCEAGSEEALRREPADDPEPILWVDGRPALISGERSTEIYSCDDVL